MLLVAEGPPGEPAVLEAGVPGHGSAESQIGPLPVPHHLAQEALQAEDLGLVGRLEVVQVLGQHQVDAPLQLVWLLQMRLGLRKYMKQ